MHIIPLWHCLQFCGGISVRLYIAYFRFHACKCESELRSIIFFFFFFFRIVRLAGYGVTSIFKPRLMIFWRVARAGIKSDNLLMMSFRWNHARASWTNNLGRPRASDRRSILLFVYITRENRDRARKREFVVVIAGARVRVCAHAWLVNITDECALHGQARGELNELFKSGFDNEEVPTRRYI